MSNALIQVQSLSKYYGSFLGLNQVSFSITPGITGLVGPNGAGKSTLLNLLMGQLRPSEGQLWVLGEAPWNNPKLFYRLGFCPGHDALYSFYTGFEFLVFMLRLQGIKRQEARTRAEIWLDKLDLTESMHRKISGYSRGMRQRVKLAQALAHNPELLLLDEPLTGIDPVAKNMIKSLIQEFKTKGKSVVISSHVLPELEGICDQFLLINQGRILAFGRLELIRQLLDQHPHRISIRCHPMTPLANYLLQEDLISGLSIESDNKQLTVLSQNSHRFYQGLTQFIAQHDIHIDEISSKDDNLEAVFRYLLEKDAISFNQKETQR